MQLFSPTHTLLLSNLLPGIIINDTFLTEQDCTAANLRLTIMAKSTSDGTLLQTKLTNCSGKDIRLNRFAWRYTAGINDFLSIPSKDIRVFVEGWTMASPAGCLKFGDKDFAYNPEYINSAVASSADYDNSAPNHFRFEYATIIKNSATGDCLLGGFVTSFNQFTGGKMVLDDQGVNTLEFFSLCDDCLVPPEGEITSESLIIINGTDDNALLCRFAELWGENMHARTTAPLPLGWCSWYYYFENVTENDILKNADYIASHRDQYPLAYLQLDDGYQTACGDWLSCNDKFPHGLAWLAEQIKARGLKPGVWFAPFFAENTSKIAQEHPDWLVHDKNGTPIQGYPWRDGTFNYSLDGTHPEVQAHLRSLFHHVRQTGIDYIKLDFMIAASNLPGAVFHDPTATRAQALRRGLEAIREGFGDDGFILGCTAPFGGVVGIVDGERIATDITPFWTKAEFCHFTEAPTVPNVCRNLVNRTYMHRRLWINDPDTLIVREKNNELTSDEASLWCDAVYYCGGSLMLSDNLPELETERAAWTKKLVQTPDSFETFPEDRLEHTPPQRWSARDRATGTVTRVIFNLTDQPIQVDGKDYPPHTSRLRQ